MNNFKYYFLLLCTGFIFSSCEDKDYPLGLPQYEHHYYSAYLPNNNSQVNVQRTQAAPLKLAVQFYSSFTREYDAVAHYAIVTTGITNPAVAGVDFNIVDKEGTVLQPVDGKYTLTFPQAVKKVDTIYVKMLNNPAAGARKMEIQLQENKTDAFYVDIFSTAFRRPVEIR
jgi:hypothetical protein